MYAEGARHNAAHLFIFQFISIVIHNVDNSVDNFFAIAFFIMIRYNIAMDEKEKTISEGAPPPDKKARRIFYVISCLALSALFVYYAVSCFIFSRQFSAETETQTGNLVASLLIWFLSSAYAFVCFLLGLGAVAYAAVFVYGGISLLKRTSTLNAAEKKKRALAVTFLFGMLALIASAFTFAILLGRVIVHGPQEYLSAFLQIGLLPFALSLINTVLNRMTQASLKNV